jgi:hypothetical protein
MFASSPDVSVASVDCSNAPNVKSLVGRKSPNRYGRLLSTNWRWHDRGARGHTPFLTANCDDCWTLRREMAHETEI